MMDHILLEACRNGQKQIVQWALDQGANTRTMQKTGPQERALDHAALNGYKSIVNLLIETHKQRGRIDNEDSWRQQDLSQALPLAARRGWLEIAQLLIANGANVNSIARRSLQCPLTFIPTFQAVQRGGQVEMVELLLMNGAKTDTRIEQWDSTIRELILSLSIQNGYFSVLSMLVNTIANEDLDSSSLRCVYDIR